VFDFDGVLCDSLEECMMVAWYAYDGKPVRWFLNPGLAGVPDDVVARFQGCRPFMRHLAHFLVPLVEHDLPGTHGEFATRFDALPGEQIESFARAAEGFRAKLRARHPEPWRARHTVDVRLADLVRDGYIATARDRDSVGQILGSHGIEVPESRIFGSLRDKTEALAKIAERESLDPLHVVLVDDSVENCLAARSSGFDAYWASWGYHADGDAATAVRHGISVVTVEALLRVRCATLS
jgi:phosphoglycolate phosphatase-like HAD superfamily hydrolase